jgi:dipeptidyl aminopeptidase/acylaminoacyl peptidase
MKIFGWLGALAACVFSTQVSAEELLPISAFARLPAIDDVSVSPDGRYVSWISVTQGTRVAVVADRNDGGKLKVVLRADKDDHFQMRWCNWGNNTRLVCGFRAMTNELGVVFPVTRMVAVNADGTEIKVLIQNGRAGVSQFQDEVIDWTPDDPNTVLVEADDDRNTFPTVFKLNIYTGNMAISVREREPIRNFRSDGRGRVRLGWGFVDKRISYFAKLENESSWLRLARVDAFSEHHVMRPIAMSPGRNKVFATAIWKGRDALWEMDLADRENPVLLFDHALVDADTPLLAKDGRMLGVFYETDRPFAFYTDERARAVIAAVKTLLPAGAFNVITDMTQDERFYVIRSSSDVDSRSYALLDTKDGKLELLGSAYPELAKAKDRLARMTSIRYPANDGTEIPGYLTVPANLRPEKLPLVVLPHGGPVARDSWQFDWLTQFLASRGYAVLQMNFRGSSGYGLEWLYAAHQDWGGLTYSDITDGTKWAVKQGIADPDRICIVGASFGGYAALLGAVRDSNLYKCSVSIAGVSDLIELQDDSRAFVNSAIAREQIGTNRDKLKGDSPRRHAESVQIPVLLVHGNKDSQVNFDHSDDMVSALKRAKKNYKLVEIDDGDHQFSREADRVKLLSELETFLKAHLSKDPPAH